jgi:phage major head subunit gpT-like protein
VLINTANLDRIRVGFKTVFQGQLEQTKTQYQQIATEVPSSAKEEKYGWLGKIPGVVEWVGPRQVQNLMEYDYAIKNKSYELTIGVDRDDVEDDTLGVYAPLFQTFGESVAAWPDQIVFSLLAAGHTTFCYDQQYFFDTDHPVLDAAGTAQSVSNSFSGAGPAWFLLNTRRALKPLIWQLRKPGLFVALDRPDDPNVFSKKEFQYGWDGRGNAGFGFWQMAVRSTKTLNADNYEEARTALLSFKSDFGRPLNLLNGGNPLLVLPRTLEGAARGVVASQLVNGGETNKWAGTADLFVCDWLNA